MPTHAKWDVYNRGSQGYLLEFSRAQRHALDGNLSQLHLIAGQSASFVTEDVLHLAQILVQIAVTGFGKLTSAGVLHRPAKAVIQALEETLFVHQGKRIPVATTGCN